MRYMFFTIAPPRGLQSKYCYKSSLIPQYQASLTSKLNGPTSRARILPGCLGFTHFISWWFYALTYLSQILRGERAWNSGRFDTFWLHVRNLGPRYGQKQLFWGFQSNTSSWSQEATYVHTWSHIITIGHTGQHYIYQYLVTGDTFWSQVLRKSDKMAKI